jgi:hypothetical protein
MTRIPYPVRIPPPVSPRTVKYVEAMIHEGDNFEFAEWLERVRKEESQARQVGPAVISGEVAEIAGPLKTSDGQHGRPNPPLQLIRKTIRVPRTLRRPYRQGQSQTPKARLRRWLEKVHRAWDDFQASRARDAVYEYLAAVFAIVMHYKVRRRTRRLVRHAFGFANLPFDKNADAFSAVIRCTCDNTVDPKTISKYARALRYVARCKKSHTELSEFMKKAGGVNGCAARYARRNG